MIKFTPKFIGVTNNPVLIVGEKPGKTRDASTIALVGNRTGDFVAEAIGDRQNIILTNVVNYLYPQAFDRQIGLADGILELIQLVEEYKPSVIICLGAVAQQYAGSIVSDCPKVYLRHPSWVNRFQTRLRHEYIKLLTNAIDSRISADQGLG